MKLNGHDCIDPTLLKFIQGGGSSYWWSQKANIFSIPCGVDPGEGHVLIEERYVPADLTECNLVIGGNTIKVVASRAVEAIPSSNSPTPTSAVVLKLFDLRHYLKMAYVGRAYNVVQRHDISGNPVYYRWSLNEDASHLPWTWEAMIADLWSRIPGVTPPTLYHSNAQYPTHNPQNYEFHKSSLRDALAVVLRDIGHTLVPKNDFSVGIEALSSDLSVDNFTDTIEAFKDFANAQVIDLKHFTTGTAGKLPEKLVFLFPYISALSQSRERPYYSYEHTVIPQFAFQEIATGTKRTVVAPLTAAYSIVAPTVPLNKTLLDAFANHVGPRLTRLLFGQSGGDLIFSGLQTIHPSRCVGRVTWMDTGSNVISDGNGPITRVEQAFLAPVQQPEDVPHPIQVFKFQLCSDSTSIKYFSNPEIVDHLPEGSLEATSVAVIDGECWQLIGYADRCHAGECVEIQTWIESCSDCAFGCFTLTPCTTGSSRLVIGDGWIPLIGKVVKLDDVCYTVGVATLCEDAEELDAPTSSHANCSTCNQCWDLIKCGTTGSGEGETLRIFNDLVTELNHFSPHGKVVRIGGSCWEISGPRACTGTESYASLDIDPETELPYLYESCEACGCYKLTPCSGQSITAPIYIKTAIDDETETPINLADLISDGEDVVMLNTGYCYLLEVSTVCGDVQETPVRILETFESCECCKITRWLKCESDPPTYITTYSDLCEAIAEGSTEDPVVIKRAQDEYCYIFDSYIPNLTGSEVPITVEGIFPNCETCINPIYKLDPICHPECDNNCDPDEGGEVVPPEPIYTSDEEFKDIIGKFVAVAGVCYFVTRYVDDEDQTITEDVCFEGPYDTCQDCLEAPKYLDIVENVIITDDEIILKKVKIQFKYIVCERRDEVISEVAPCPPEP